MRAIAEHHVDQDHADRGIGERARDVLVADLGLDHRVRPAARVLVVAEVDEAVTVAGRGAGR